ncbi:hypothetical protein GCM10018966_039480 [Streptomyces yanii]
MIWTREYAALTVDRMEQLAERRTEGVDDRAQRVDRRAVHVPLDVAEVAAGQARLLCERLQREALYQALPTEVLTDPVVVRGTPRDGWLIISGHRAYPLVQ